MPLSVALLRRSLPLSTASVSDARLATTEALQVQGASAALIEVVALATSELCANAVQAGEGTSFDLHVFASEDGSRAALRVQNDGSLRNIPDRSTWRPADPLARRGRGLGIVDAIAESLEFDASDGRLTVLATFGEGR